MMSLSEGGLSLGLSLDEPTWANNAVQEPKMQLLRTRFLTRYEKTPVP
jgi:hypothetical protein